MAWGSLYSAYISFLNLWNCSLLMISGWRLSSERMRSAIIWMGVEFNEEYIKKYKCHTGPLCGIKHKVYRNIKSFLGIYSLWREGDLLFLGERGILKGNQSHFSMKAFVAKNAFIASGGKVDSSSCASGSCWGVFFLVIDSNIISNIRIFLVYSKFIKNKVMHYIFYFQYPQPNICTSIYIVCILNRSHFVIRPFTLFSPSRKSFLKRRSVAFRLHFP